MSPTGTGSPSSLRHLAQGVGTPSVTLRTMFLTIVILGASVHSDKKSSRLDAPPGLSIRELSGVDAGIGLLLCLIEAVTLG